MRAGSFSREGNESHQDRRATSNRGYGVRSIHVRGAVTPAGNFSSNLSRSFAGRDQLHERFSMRISQSFLQPAVTNILFSLYIKVKVRFFQLN